MTVIVTDHALVRFLERVHGIDMEFFRNEAAKLAEPYASIKAGCAEIGGFWFVFDGEKLVTITPTRPTPRSQFRHDREFRNGTNMKHKRMHWKGLKRKRAHK